MNIKEKAEHFYNTAVEAATSLNTSMVMEYKSGLEKSYQEHKEEVLKRAEAHRKQESERLAREKNASLAMQTMSIRHKVSEFTNEYKEALFSDVRKRLEDFMRTPEYIELLVRQIKEAVQFSEGSDIIVYINPTDADKLQELSRLTGAALTISKTDFMGGMRAVIRDKDILINNSFESKLMEQKEAFIFM